MLHPKSFNEIYKLTLAGLVSCYCKRKKKSFSFEVFTLDIFSIIYGLDDRNIQDPYEIVMQFVSEEDRNKGQEYVISSPYSAILVASTFLMRAGFVSEENNIDLAWSYMADARYWYGVVESTEGIEKAYAETVVSTKREAALKGAKARGDVYPPVIFYAHELARELCPKSTRWKSRNHAVQSIKKKVMQFASDKSIRLSEGQADVTLGKWLAKMPDAGELFPTKKLKKEA